jgi:hypothetical protein
METSNNIPKVHFYTLPPKSSVSCHNRDNIIKMLRTLSNTGKNL